MQAIVLDETVTAIDAALERVSLTIQVSEAGPTMFFKVIVTH